MPEQEIIQIKENIDHFFSNTGRSVSQTRAGLEDVVEHIEILIESLPSDED